MIKLHGLDISGNTYKAKLLMHLLNIPYEFFEIDIKNKQHKSNDFLTLNPRGEFPVLEDGKIKIWDSQAILIYLSCLNERTHWYPDNAKDMATITQWLTVANGDIFPSLGKARSMLKFGHAGNLKQYQEAGIRTLKWLEGHLSQQNWLATDTCSIADIACYPYIALCEEGDISLCGYTAIHQWFKRIQQLDGYIDMPGINQYKRSMIDININCR